MGTRASVRTSRVLELFECVDCIVNNSCLLDRNLLRLVEVRARFEVCKILKLKRSASPWGVPEALAHKSVTKRNPTVGDRTA